MSLKTDSVHINIIDPLNPGCGFQIRLEDRAGDTSLFTSVDPITGEDLLSVAHCLRVAAAFSTP